MIYNVSLQLTLYLSWDRQPLHAETPLVFWSAALAMLARDVGARLLAGRCSSGWWGVAVRGLPITDALSQVSFWLQAHVWSLPVGSLSSL